MSKALIDRIKDLWHYLLNCPDVRLEKFPLHGVFVVCSCGREYIGKGWINMAAIGGGVGINWTRVE